MPRQGVQFIQNDEPSFIKQFKQRIGHKSEPDVDAKRAVPNFEEDSDDENPEPEDEKPVVVVLKPSDLTAEEADVEQEKINKGPARLDEKITFKKPTKRTAEQAEQANQTDTGKVKKKDDTKPHKKSQSSKTKHNSSLLSFGEDDEDDDEG